MTNKVFKRSTIAGFNWNCENSEETLDVSLAGSSLRMLSEPAYKVIQ